MDAFTDEDDDNVVAAFVLLAFGVDFVVEFEDDGNADVDAGVRSSTLPFLEDEEVVEEVDGASNGYTDVLEDVRSSCKRISPSRGHIKTM